MAAIRVPPRRQTAGFGIASDSIWCMIARWNSSTKTEVVLWMNEARRIRTLRAVFWFHLKLDNAVTISANPVTLCMVLSTHSCSSLCRLLYRSMISAWSQPSTWERSRSDTRTPSLDSISLHADRYLRLHSGELTLSGSQMSVSLETWTASVNSRPAKGSANEDHGIFIE